MKEQYHAHVAAGGKKKKKSNPKRTTNRNGVYPIRLKKLLKDATGIHATGILVNHGGLAVCRMKRKKSMKNMTVSSSRKMSNSRMVGWSIRIIG